MSNTILSPSMAASKPSQKQFWFWFAGDIGASVYDIALEETNRATAIYQAEKVIPAGCYYQIVEAKPGEPTLDAAIVPFSGQRNFEVRMSDPKTASQPAVLEPNWSAVVTLLCHHTEERPLHMGAALYDAMNEQEEVRPFLSRAKRVEESAA